MPLHRSLTILAAFFLLWFPAIALQEPDHGLSWYQSFFEERQRFSFEETIKEDSAKLETAKVSNDLAAEARMHKELGLLYLTRMKNYQLAMDFFIYALAIEDSLKAKEDLVFTYMAIAQVFEEVGNFQKSAEFLDRALETNRPLNNNDNLVYLLNKLGKVKMSQGLHEAAMADFELALEHRDESTYQTAEADALFNIARLLVTQGKYDTAMNAHKRVLALRRSVSDKKNEAQSLNDIGELYRLMKNDERAFSNYKVALEIRQALDDKDGLAESYNNIGALYYAQQNYERAIANLQLGVEAARQADNLNQRLKGFDYLSLCYRQLGNYGKALAYREEFVGINDLIEREKRDQRLLETEISYELGKKEEQLKRMDEKRAQQDKEMAEQRKVRNFLFAIIGLAVVIAILVLYLYLQKQRSNKKLQAVHAKVNQQNQALQALNAMKDKFFSIISHDLKGPLNSLTSFSGLLINHTDSLTKDEIKMLALDLDKSLKNLFALLQNLLEWSRSATGNMDFKLEVFDLGTLLEENKELLSVQMQNKKISIRNLNTDKLYVNAHKQSVNTVIRNLISNAIKFTSEGGTITLDVKKSIDRLTVSVADTGVGMSQDIVKKLFRIDSKHSTPGTANEKGTGLGLILCREFIEKNGGKIWVESEEGKGSVFYFTLPYTSVPAYMKSTGA